MRNFTLLLCCVLLLHANAFAQFASIQPLTPLTVSATTADKPQSKVWEYAGSFWTVLPNSSGTHLWRLIDDTWEEALFLSSATDMRADCKIVGNVAHILIFKGKNSELVSLEFDQEQDNYKLWSLRSATAAITLDNSAETATIDIDGTGRMWLAYSGNQSSGKKRIYARWSVPPYSNWNSTNKHTFPEEISSDDICAVIAMPGKIGVLWSNQLTKRFGFSTHTDGTDADTWSQDEMPGATQAADNIGGGMADDHLNMAVADDGTLYCAVKTSYDNGDYPEIILLVRRPDGTWDDLYEVTHRGTRPIVLLNQEASKVVVVYTLSDGGDNIAYKDSPTDNIAFGQEHILMSGGSYNNVTSTKANYSGQTVILASSGLQAFGVRASDPITSLPIELLHFSAKRAGNSATLEWATASETDNSHFNIEVSTDGKHYTSTGHVAGHGTTVSLQHYAYTDPNIARYGSKTLYYRLRQVDYGGTYSFSPVRVIQAGSTPGALAVQAYPNPFTDSFHLTVTSPHHGQALIQLHTLEGRVAYRSAQELESGHNQLLLQNLNLPAGIYILSVQLSDGQQQLKLIKQ
ncbi:T9SS type A sorting domain-containing protein [Pontibacter mangrovi]|uniref:T9SS type A sorting domain-containing protein n=1 Tax=Pontibacter mangrovi TaxID=2589816 RepID=A0A501WBP9_9BACT|nr:T9SS type A sorting domain-containing protein [Pontibacter mangrovi]TPE44237.1 T9SS type A sorting domain-containing protein [Pontibacter mangrovi]